MFPAPSRAETSLISLVNGPAMQVMTNPSSTEQVTAAQRARQVVTMNSMLISTLSQYLIVSSCPPHITQAVLEAVLLPVRVQMQRKHQPSNH